MSRRWVALPRKRGERGERGATVLVVALVLSLLLVIAAFAVDIGMQRVARSDMQSLADVVALDLAREMDGSTVSELEAVEGSLAAASLDRNTDVINFAGNRPDLAVDWGELDAAGEFVPLGGSANPSAVRVVAETTVGFAFGPIAGVEEGDADRGAVASAETAACFSLGSYAARLDTSSSVLLKGLVEDALAGSLNLDAASYRGIADADISLLALAAELGLGSVDELLTTNVTAAGLFIAAAKVLAGEGNTADANVLNAIAAHVGGHDISLGQLISARSGDGAAETASINALDLVTGTAFVANGTNALSIPDLGVRLPLLGTSLTQSLHVIEKARKACGRKGQATADTAQVSLDVEGTLASVGGEVLGLRVTGGQTSLSVDVASAHGRLTDVICGDETVASPSGEDVQVTKGLVGASLSTRVRVDGTVGTGGGLLGSLLGGLGLGGLLGDILTLEIHGDINLQAGTADPAEVETARIRVPVNPSGWGEPYPLGSGELGLNTASVVASPPPTLTIVARGLLGVRISLNASQLLGITTNLVSALTASLVNPLLTSVNGALLEPLTDLLGVKLGGADVFGEKPVCGNPRLVG